MDKRESYTFFTGSAQATYRATRILEYGIGSSLYHSITAMNEYANMSNEEIRIEDCNASGVLFGSVFAKIGGQLCVEPKYKLRPYLLGELYQAAVDMIQPTNKLQQNKFDKKQAVSETPLKNGFKVQNQSEKSNSINVSVVGQPFKVLTNGPGMTGVNVMIIEKPATKEDAQPLETLDFRHQVKGALSIHP